MAGSAERSDHNLDLQEMARQVMDTNRYLTLGTNDPDDRPRVSPLYFTHHGYRDFYWVSSPTAHHSANIARRPRIAIVIFDSTAPIGQGQAVYLDADAYIVTEEDLARGCAEAFAQVAPGAKKLQPHELSGEAALRLYRARATACEVHIPGRHPKYGVGIDKRQPVQLW